MVWIIVGNKSLVIASLSWFYGWNQNVGESLNFEHSQSFFSWTYLHEVIGGWHKSVTAAGVFQGLLWALDPLWSFPVCCVFDLQPGFQVGCGYFSGLSFQWRYVLFSNWRKLWGTSLLCRQVGLSWDVCSLSAGEIRSCWSEGVSEPFQPAVIMF